MNHNIKLEHIPKPYVPKIGDPVLIRQQDIKLVWNVAGIHGDEYWLRRENGESTIQSLDTIEKAPTP